jgi:flagellar motor switch protein FliM
MAKVLYQDEIDSLLSQVEETPEALKQAAPLPAAGIGNEALSYDFRHPNRFSKDQLRSFQSLHDNFSGQFGSSLSGFTRSVVDVDLLSVDQITYAEFICSMTAPSCSYIFSMAPLGGLGLIDLNPSVSFAFVDRMFGGKGNGDTPGRELTGIEKSITAKIVDKAFQGLAKSWEHIIKITFKSISLETNPQFIQIVPQGETVIVVSLQVKMQTSSGIIRICYPYLALESILDKLSAQDRPNGRNGDADKNLQARNVQQILPVSTDLVAMLGGTIVSIKDLIEIKIGDVIRLDATDNDEITLQVGGLSKFAARPGRIGNHMAVRITKVTS